MRHTIRLAKGILPSSGYLMLDQMIPCTPMSFGVQGDGSLYMQYFQQVKCPKVIFVVHQDEGFAKEYYDGNLEAAQIDLPLLTSFLEEHYKLADVFQGDGCADIWKYYLLE